VRVAADLCHDREEALAIVSCKKNVFRIIGNPVSPDDFHAWLAAEGRSNMREALRNTRCKWWFGNRRARRVLHRNVRTAFRPGGTFSNAMAKQLSRLPIVVRSTAIGIQKSGHRQLYTFDATTSLSVVLRGVVRNDYKVLMVKELAQMPHVQPFPGLAERVIAKVALEAEDRFFEFMARGRPYVDESGRGIILEVDRDFRWRLDGTNGHYFYAASMDEGVDLTSNKERRRFMGTIKEMVQAQTVFLARMRAEEVAEMREGFRLKRRVDSQSGDGTMTLRLRRTREVVRETEEVLS
jgi:hypothetical protein